MFNRHLIAAAIAFACAGPALAQDAELGKIREEIKQMKDAYEKRIQELEKRLSEAEAKAGRAEAAATNAASTANKAEQSASSADRDCRGGFRAQRRERIQSRNVPDIARRVRARVAGSEQLPH